MARGKHARKRARSAQQAHSEREKAARDRVFAKPPGEPGDYNYLPPHLYPKNYVCSDPKDYTSATNYFKAGRTLPLGRVVYRIAGGPFNYWWGWVIFAVLCFCCCFLFLGWGNSCRVEVRPQP